MGDNVIEINLYDLQNDIISLQSLISEYESIILNLFNMLKDSCINWQDGNSLNFEDNIYLDKNEIGLYLDSIKDKKELLSYIYEKYITIGSKVKCNLDKKSLILNKINTCYNIANSIVNEFNKIDKGFYYQEQRNIENQKNKIIKVRNKLNDLKTSVTNLYKKLEGIEESVENKIKSLEEIKINDFGYNIKEDTYE